MFAILSGESIKGWQSVAGDFCKSDHLQLSISHFWPFNVAKCCQRNSRDNGPSHSRKKHGVWTSWPNIATKFAKRGTHKSLLLLNWSSWHHAASATRWTEFESNTKSPTSPGESSARLPTGPQPHRHLWCHCGSTWSAQKGHGGVYTAPREDGISKKGTFMPSKPQSSKNFAFVGGRPYYHLDGAKCKISFKPRKPLPGCTKPLYFRGHNDKPVGKQISKTNWWCDFPVMR